MEIENYSNDSNDDARSWASGQGAPYTLKTKALKKVAAEILRASNSERAAAKFWAEGAIRGADVVVTVDQIGQLNFPINQETVMKLIKVASPARYGLGEQTLMDTTVRDTHMIPADNLSVNIKKLPEIFNNIKSSMGLDQNCVLEASLFNMLVYQKGQFFDFHRDSEKMENMIATLVMVLPSEHQGGDLIIQHMLKSYTFTSKISKEHSYVKYVAFYADCRHKVERVTEGHRIVITYNIILQSGIKTTPLDTPPELVAAVDNFFKNTEERKLRDAWYIYIWEDENYGERKLAFLLDYQYTKDGLKWDRLKGEDRKKAGLLIDVANKLNMKVFLAQTDILETWHSLMSNTDINYGTEFGTFRTKLFAIKDLDDKEIDLPGAKLRSGELCFNVKNTEGFRPYKSKFEPTGNEGCTLERWYNRAAIVLWSADDHYKFFMLWKRQETFGNLCRLTDKPGNEEQVKMYIKLAGKYLYSEKEFPYMEIRKDLDSLIKMAVYIKDEIVAANMTRDLLPYIFTPELNQHAYRLVKAYGLDWYLQIILSSRTVTSVVSNIAISFAVQLNKTNYNGPAVSAILHQQLFVGINEYKLPYELPASLGTPARQYDSYADSIVTVLKEFSTTRIEPLTDEIENLLKASAIKSLGLARAILKCYNKRLHQVVFHNLTITTVEILNRFVDKFRKQLHDKNDWSIEFPFHSCERKDCLYCKELTAFLKSPEKSFNFTVSASHFIWSISHNDIIKLTKSTDPNDPAKQIGIIEKLPLLFTKIEKMKRDIEAVIVSLSAFVDLERRNTSNTNTKSAKIQRV